MGYMTLSFLGLGGSNMVTTFIMCDIYWMSSILCLDHVVIAVQFHSRSNTPNYKQGITYPPFGPLQDLISTNKKA